MNLNINAFQIRYFTSKLDENRVVIDNYMFECYEKGIFLKTEHVHVLKIVLTF